MENLPTNAVGLIAFITLAYVGSLGTIIWYFLKAQRNQTRMYMDYIEKKNGNLERVTTEFTKHLKDTQDQHARELEERESRLRECLVSKS